MQIYIFDEKIDKNDEKTIQLLDGNLLFRKKIREIRKKFNIPKFGFDCASASLEGNYLSDFSGKKLKLAKPFPKEKTEKADACMAAFLDDPDTAISGKGQFGKEIEKLRKSFNLEKRWYHPICHLVLFSIPGWLNSPITSFIDKPGVKSLWKRPGIVIRVSANVSKKQFVKWLDENWGGLRNRLKNELGIEKRKGLPRKIRIKLLREIVRMKADKTSFEKMANKLTNQYKPEDPEYKTVESANALQKFYSRYQKAIGLTPAKKSHKK